jgi:hypothetical protein
LKATTEILNLIAFLLGSPDYALLHELYLRRRPAGIDPPRNKRLAKKKAAN